MIKTHTVLPVKTWNRSEKQVKKTKNTIFKLFNKLHKHFIKKVCPQCTEKQDCTEANKNAEVVEVFTNIFLNAVTSTFDDKTVNDVLDTIQGELDYFKDYWNTKGENK